MSKKRQTRNVCLLEECGTYAVAGLKVCKTHSATAHLQGEVDRLRVLTQEGIWRIRRYPEVRRLIEVMGGLEARADSSASNGRLGAALANVKSCADDIGHLADGAPGKGPAPSVAHCGDDECPRPGRAQKADAVFCGWCGSLMPGKSVPVEDEPPTVTGVDESRQDAVRASQPIAVAPRSPKGGKDDLEAQLERDRQGLYDAFRKSVAAR